MTEFLSTRAERLGIVLAPDGSPLEAEGVLNPGITRDRDGALLMFPRVVAAGNVSRIGVVACAEQNGSVSCRRLGFALEPEAPYEMRAAEGWHGCEDPRVTFVPALDSFVMTYTAFGGGGARIALAVSHDAYSWRRLGLLRFAQDGLNERDNKDAAIFPEPVLSPAGVESFAIYHRPMLEESVNGQAPISLMLSLAPQLRESLCIAYVPVGPVLDDIAQLCFAAESAGVLGVGSDWGTLKNGAGTPPVRTEAGWLSFFHGVDATQRNGAPSLLYRAGIVIHDERSPHIVRYRSPVPVLGPATADERFGTVDDVVFPTGIDPRPDGSFDVYYGAADAKIGLVRFSVAFDAITETRR